MVVTCRLFFSFCLFNFLIQWICFFSSWVYFFFFWPWKFEWLTWESDTLSYDISDIITHCLQRQILSSVSQHFLWKSIAKVICLLHTSVSNMCIPVITINIWNGGMYQPSVNHGWWGSFVARAWTWKVCSAVDSIILFGLILYMSPWVGQLKSVWFSVLILVVSVCASHGCEVVKTMLFYIHEILWK